MKKLFVIFATAALICGAASCQKEKLSGDVPTENTDTEKIDGSDDSMQKLTVFVPSNDTKLSFNEGTIDNKTVILRKFSVDDKGQELFGCVKVNDKYEKFSYKIEAVEEVTGGVSMTLNKCFGKPGVPSNGEGTKVHFIYAPGHSCENITEEGVLPLDLAVQHEGYIPAVMTATGVVGSDNKVTLNFKNQTSILAIVPPAEGSMLNDCNNTTAYSGCSFTSMKINALTKATLTFDETSGASVSNPVAGIAELSAKESWTENSTIYSTVFPGTCNIVATIAGVKKGETDMGDFEYVPAGAVTVGDNAYLRIKKPFCHVAEARVEGDKKYDTFNAAMDAANAAEGAATVILLRDCEVKKSTDVTNANGVTLDLNGKILTENGKNRFTLATSGATLTIKDSDGDGMGKILQTSAENYAVQSTGGSLTIEGGEICSAEDAKFYTIYFSEGAGDLTMSGGKIINTGEKYGVYFASSGNVNISDGYITSFGYPALGASKGNVNIVGGFFKCGASYSVLSKSEPAVFSVSGGYFSKGVNEDLLAEGYDNLPTEEYEGYPIMVAHALTKVAEFQQQGCEPQDMATIREAVDAANEATAPSTIKLVADCVVSLNSKHPAADITNSNKVTLDLNGYSLTQNSSSRLGVAEQGYLIVKDSQSGGKVIQASTSSNTFSISSGTLEIAGGSIEQASGATVSNVVVSSTGNLVVSGGAITSESTATDAIQFNNATGNLTVSGGTITSPNRYGVYMTNTSTATMTVSGGTITSGANNAIYFSSDGNLDISGGQISATSKTALYLTNGKVTISNGELTSDSSIGIALQGDNVDLTISGGTIKSTNSNAISATKGKLDVTGGFFSCKDGLSEIYRTTGATSDVSVTAGYFNSNKFSNNVLASGYSCYQTNEYTDYPYSVLPTGVALLNDGTGKVVSKPTVEAAVTAANNASGDCTITLVDNYTMTANSSVTKNKVVFDLNGNTLKQKANDYRLGVSGSGYLKIIDSKETGKITQTGDSNTIVISSGTMEIAGGSIEQAANATKVNVLVSSTGNLVVSGGAITSASTATDAIQFNNAQGSLTVSGGTITSPKRYGVYMTNTSTATMTVSGGTITSNSNNAIRYFSKNTLAISNGTVMASTSGNAVYAETGSTVNISGGEIKAVAASALLANDADVTISGGTVESTCNVSDTSAVYFVRSKVTIKDNANIIHTAGRGAHFVGLNSTTYTEATISNGSITCGEYPIYVGNRAKVTVNGGTFESNGYKKDNTNYICQAAIVNSNNGCELTINDGYFKASSKSYGIRRYSTSDPVKATCTISGGHFNIQPGSNADGLGDDKGNFINAPYVLKSDGGADYPYYVIKNETPSYPGTDKAPVKIGNIWWAPVNCGYNNSYPNGLLYQWGRKYGQPYDENRDDTVSGPVARTSDANYQTGFIKDKTNYICWYSNPSSTDTWDGSYNPCPDGWRVPTKSELESLGTGSWNNGTRVFDGGLTFQAAGRTSNGGTSDSSSDGYYWSSTTDGANYAIYMKIDSYGKYVYNNDNIGYRSRGMSVRCVKDAN